jgi:uncharacterized protein (TIGR01244 family)
MRLIQKSALTALIALALVAPVPAQLVESDESSRSAAAADTSRIRIENFGRINERYYRGAQPRGRDYADLAALGVKTVINLTSDDRDESEQGLVERAGMKYVHIPMTTHEPPTEANLATFFGVVDDVESNPVYVHCVGGRHRTGVMTAVYRMTRHGWDAQQAFREMKRFDFGADFLHREFKDFVFAYGAQAARKAAEAGAAALSRGVR